MWKTYNEAGRQIVQALAELGETVTHDGPEPCYYPNRIRAPDDIEVRFSLSAYGEERWIYIELPDRIACAWNAVDWKHVAGRISERFKAVRDARAERLAREQAERDARSLNDLYELGGTPFRMVSLGSTVHLVLMPVTANEAQVLAMKEAARACGLL